MPKKPLVYLGILAALGLLLLAPAHTTSLTGREKNTEAGAETPTLIDVALYDTWGRNNRYIEDILEYNWTAGNHTYRFRVTTINADAVSGLANTTLTTENFDVFIIGASADSYLVDGLDPTWKHNVQQFVANGGGYLGICGGANAASLGFEQPRNWFQRRVNRGALGLAGVYINDYFLGEWQYLLKYGFGRPDVDYGPNVTSSYISVNTSVHKTPDNAIFRGYNGSYRAISYAGGPGMYPAGSEDPKHGSLIPLLTYNEEPMYTKPIHYWRPTVFGWKILGNVTTDLYGTYAGVATTYNGDGRVVLYGPHPEDRVVVNGTIYEYRGTGMLTFFFPFETYVFNYAGISLGETYNWWIVRRSAAWAANIPVENLPPVT
ncbi:MAG: hypothetical protein R6U10_05050 [Thermoplasmatota archaeon]